MVIKVEKVTDEIKDMLKLKRALDSCMAEEKRLEDLLEQYTVNNVFELIHDYPEVAIEEGMVDCDYEFDSEDYVYQLETAEWLYYLNRKVELEGTIKQFETSELFQKYRKSCVLLDKYKTLVAEMDENKKENQVKETDTLIEEIFYRVKEYCREIMISASHNLFIEPLKFNGVKGDTIYLLINSEWAKNRTDERFKEYMEQQFERILGKLYEIVIEVEDKV